MHCKSQVERLLQRFRRKIAEVSDLSGHLAENFAGLDSVAADTLRSLDADQPFLGRQLRLRVAAGDNAFERAVTLETGLARALAHEQLETTPLEPAELHALVTRSSLDFAGQLRVIYHLTFGDDPSWKALRELETPTRPEPSLDPVVRALRTLVGHGKKIHLRGEAWAANDENRPGRRPDDLAPMHRVAVERAASEPLGFCRLVLEEALALSRAADGPNSAPLAYIIDLVDDPFLAAEDPVRHADLMARAALYLAEYHALANQLEHHQHWLDIAVPLLAEGSHDTELRALYFETRAARSVREGKILPALRSLLRANVMLTELRPVDRRAEVLLRYAIVLGHHPGAAKHAPLVLESARSMLAGLEPEIHPSLRLRFRHFLAEAELVGAYRRAGAFLLDEHGLLLESGPGAPEALAPVTPDPEAPLDGNRSRGKGGHLDDPGGMGGPARALEAAARDWFEALRDEAGALERATLHLGAAEGHYDRFGTPALRLRRSWLLGRAQVVSHPELALIYLLDAQSGFEDRGDEPLARLAAVDVCACLLHLGRTDEALGWVEALGRRQAPWRDDWNACADSLLLLVHRLLPDHGGRETDSLLGDLLDARLTA